MESQRYAFQIFAEPVATAAERDFILFFHRVIQESALAEACIDVADYSHVPDGPGVVLVCHEAHYSFDRTAGRLGLKCATKRGATGDTAARVLRVVEKTLRACALAESHEVLQGRLRFDTTTAQLSIEDRLVAPNTPETYESLTPVLTDVLARIWGAPPVLTRASSPKECVRLAISFPAGLVTRPFPLRPCGDPPRPR